MGRAAKIGTAIIVVLLLVSLSFYYFFIYNRVEDEEPLKPAPDFSFYDSKDFILQVEPEKKKFSDFNNTVRVLTFNDFSDQNLTEQNEVIERLVADYPEVVFINIEIHDFGKSHTTVYENITKFGYNWTFTYDKGTIAEAYDIVFIPTVVIIGKDGYGTFKAELTDGSSNIAVDYDDLSDRIEKTLNEEAGRINVGKLTDVKKAPDFSVTDVYGNTFTLSDYRGEKVILIDFMALWCSSCKQVESMLHEMYDDFNHDEFIIISIDVDPTEGAEDIKKHWEEEGIQWSVARDPGEIKLKYQVSEIAKVVIIDKRGFMVYEHVGAPSRSELKSEIDDAIAGRSKAIDPNELTIYSFAVISGIATFFSPCSFPMLPGYMSYYLQKDVSLSVQAEQKEGETDETKRRKKSPVRRALGSGIISSFGIVVVFAIISLMALSASTQVKEDFFTPLGLVVGVIVIILGGLMLTNLQYNKIIKPFQKIYSGISSKLKKKEPETGEVESKEQKNENSMKKYYAGMFTYGLGYGAAAASCTAPIFLAVILGALVLPEFSQRVFVIIIYILSMVILMIAITLALSMAGRGAVQKLASYTGVIKKISAVVLIAAGIYLVIFNMEALGIINLF